MIRKKTYNLMLISLLLVIILLYSLLLIRSIRIKKDSNTSYGGIFVFISEDKGEFV